MRVGLFTDLTTVNSVYRALPLQQLPRRRYEVRLAVEKGRLRPDLLRGFDVVHVYRFHDQVARRAVKSLRDAGAAIVWDNDDDLMAEIQGISHSTKQGALKAQRAHAGMRRMLELAHVVTTTSPVLADQYRSWGAECVRLVENFLPAQYAVSAPVVGEDGRVTIGWTAGAEHRHDLRALGLRETLGALLDAHRQVHVVSIGLHLGIQSERYRRQGLVQYAELANHVAGFDVGIAPLDDIPFNRARSTVKLKEYAAAGVPWLASLMGPYAALGERQGGRLVSDDAWYDALERIVLDAKARCKLAKRARKWAADETVAANLGVWEAVLAEAVDIARAGSPAAGR